MDAHSTPGDYRNKFPATAGCKRILLGMPGIETPQSGGKGYLHLALAIASSFGLWILFVASVHLHEMLVGLLTTLAATVFCVFVWRSRQRHLKLRGRDVAQCWRIPWLLLSDAGVITWVLFKDLLHISPAKSLYRVTGFESSRNDPVAMAKQVLAVAYTTVSPNSIVLGIDENSRRMLFHQLECGEVSKMTLNLGAKV
jgi:multisubunit Na+/H+ antiporter MnhE subunit